MPSLPDLLASRPPLAIDADLNIASESGQIRLRHDTPQRLVLEIENTAVLRDAIKAFAPSPLALLNPRSKLRKWAKAAGLKFSLEVNGQQWAYFTPTGGISGRLITLGIQYLRAKLG